MDETAESLAHFQDLRVERAQSHLHGSRLNIEAIATEAGYADGATCAHHCARGLGEDFGIFGQICFERYRQNDGMHAV